MKRLPPRDGKGRFRRRRKGGAKNPEFFTDANGVIHPMRKGYKRIVHGKSKSWGGAYLKGLAKGD